MSFGSNNINSIIQCSDDEITLEHKQDNEYNEDDNNDDIVNQILNELGDQEEENEYNHPKSNNMELNNMELNNMELNNMELNNMELNNMELNNMELNNKNLNNINFNDIDFNNNNHNNQYDNDNLIFSNRLSNRLNDEIDFKQHIEKKTMVDEKKNKDILNTNELDDDNNWLSLININDILINIKLYKNYILILIISLITNNPIVYKQMSNINIFNTNNKLNIIAYIFQAVLFVTIYFIINIIISFI